MCTEDGLDAVRKEGGEKSSVCVQMGMLHLKTVAFPVVLCQPL